jgi:chromosome partitioning protein
MAAITIGLTNQKGGAAKTTTAAALAVIFGELGYKVLCVDNDPQGNLSLQFRIDALAEPNLAGTASDLYLKPANQVTSIATTTQFKGVDLIPASVAMAKVEPIILSRAASDLLLKTALIPYKSRYDLIFLDSPPNLGKFVINVLNASDYYIIPVDGTWALRSVDVILELAEENRTAYNLPTSFLGLFLTMVDRIRFSQELREESIRRFPKEFFKTEIRRSTLAREAAALETPVPLYAADSSLASDYRALAKELALRLGLMKGKS